MLFIFDFTVYTGYPVLYTLSGSSKRQKLHFLFSSFFFSTFSTFQEIYLLTYDIKYSENAEGITVFLPLTVLTVT